MITMAGESFLDIEWGKGGGGGGGGGGGVRNPPVKSQVAEI